MTFPTRPSLRSIATIASLHLAAATFGCGGSDHPPTARVHGTVTIDGQPVESGEIRFYPEKGRMAMGEITGGEYTLRTFGSSDGAVLGNHKVTISAVEITQHAPQNFQPPPNLTPAQVEDMKSEIETITTKWIVPEVYARRQTSPLKAEVKEGDNEIDFPITSPPRRSR